MCVLGGHIFLLHSYQEGETQPSRAGCKAGTEEQVPTISPVCSLPLGPPRSPPRWELYYISALSEATLYRAVAHMKQLTRGGLAPPF